MKTASVKRIALSTAVQLLCGRTHDSAGRSVGVQSAPAANNTNEAE
jgi:hypothetical protein